MPSNSLTSLLVRELFIAFQTISGFTAKDAQQSILAYRDYFAARTKNSELPAAAVSKRADTFLDQLETAIEARAALELDDVVIGPDFPTLDHFYYDAFDQLVREAEELANDEAFYEIIAYEIGPNIGTYDRQWLRDTTGIRITPNEVRPTPALLFDMQQIEETDPDEFDQQLLQWDKTYPDHPLVGAHLLLNAAEDEFATRAKRYLRPVTEYAPGNLGFYQDSELVINWLAHIRFLLHHEREAEALPYAEQLFRLGYDGHLVPTIVSSFQLAGVQPDKNLRKKYPLVTEQLAASPPDDLLSTINELSGLLGNPEAVADLFDQLFPPEMKETLQRQGSAKIRSLSSPSTLAGILRVKITLRDSKPPIWRRVDLPAETPLETFHAIIQTLFDWDNSHLHSFETGNRYDDPFVSPFDPFGHQYGQSYEGMTIAEMFSHSGGKKFSYTYDFGDDWKHTIQLEKQLPADPKVSYPVCITGRCAAPLDDMGGIWGYYDYLAALQDPEHEMYEDAIEWLGEDFDPKAFDVAEVNADLRRFL